jgi:hypothetical protein
MYSHVIIEVILHDIINVDRNPDQCVSVVSLLAESFNPHVRCGAAWALGIACAASGNKEALAILEPMFSDTIPFVQQVSNDGGRCGSHGNGSRGNGS